MPCVKVRHASRWQALRALAVLQKRGRKEAAVYPCASCRGWHLTSSKSAADWGRRHGQVWSTGQ